MTDLKRLMKTFFNRHDRIKKDLANMLKDVGKLFAEIEERGKLIDTLATENEGLKVVKSWQGVMHTPAYGEWNEQGYWQRGAHILGPPQIEVMCREILEALKVKEKGT